MQPQSERRLTAKTKKRLPGQGQPSPEKPSRRAKIAMPREVQQIEDMEMISKDTDGVAPLRRSL